MTSAWEAYFAGPARPAEAEGGVNWDAYSHEELYRMLWQDADVADVSTLATEWARHHTALTTHADVLREQCVALRDSWEGPGADEAVRRLETMADRVAKIAELAKAGGAAAQRAADALALARAMMPAPPGNAAAPVADAMTGGGEFSMPAVPTAPTSSSVSSLQSYMNSMQAYLSDMQSSFASMAAPPSTQAFAPAPITATTPSSAPASDMGTAFSAVGSGGASFYFGSVTEDQQKAQAVRTMQTYESSLTDSGRMLDGARGAVPPPTRDPAAIATTPAAQGGAGVPWERLVVGGGGRGGLGTGFGTGVGTGAVAGTPGPTGAAPPLGDGARVGAVPGVAGGPGPRVPHLPETAAARAGGPTGMVPPVGQRGAAADDQRHENRMPTLDHGLFTVDEPVVDLTWKGR